MDERIKKYIWRKDIEYLLLAIVLIAAIVTVAIGVYKNGGVLN